MSESLKTIVVDCDGVIAGKSQGGDYAHMTIDDFKVFYSALSNAKVAELYSAAPKGQSVRRETAEGDHGGH